MNITALDKTLLVQFLENSTIEVVVDQLMVQQWNQSKMYDRYYNACQPAECIYTHQTKNNPIYIITTLIGLLGGLITVLKLIVPRLVIFLCKKQEQPRPHIGKRISEKTISLYVTGVP
jgi:beta-lactamase regulating signal transducer with metallopeptidase domain